MPSNIWKWERTLERSWCAINELRVNARKRRIHASAVEVGSLLPARGRRRFSGWLLPLRLILSIRALLLGFA